MIPAPVWVKPRNIPVYMSGPIAGGTADRRVSGRRPFVLGLPSPPPLARRVGLRQKGQFGIWAQKLQKQT